MIKASLLLCSMVVAISGCKSPQLYDWGDYDRSLYAAYKDPAQVEALRVALETHIASMEQNKIRVAPGLYAELGTLYFQANDLKRAADFYARERTAWPESSVLMTSLIDSIERRQTVKKEKTQ